MTRGRFICHVLFYNGLCLSCDLQKLLQNKKYRWGEEWLFMQYVGLLAPIAFVFAISALAQVGALKKEVDKLKEELQSKKWYFLDDASK